jgi:hypothetical protein
MEPNEMFRIKGKNSEFILTDMGELKSLEDNVIYSQLITSAINNGIIRKPRLTDEQLRKLKALYDFGMRWLVYSVADSGSCVFATETKPKYVTTLKIYAWSGERIQIKGSSLIELVSKDDIDPLDIAETLKAAGVEVEK